MNTPILSMGLLMLLVSMSTLSFLTAAKMTVEGPADFLRLIAGLPNSLKFNPELLAKTLAS
jgi:hypothetical protein